MKGRRFTREQRYALEHPMAAADYSPGVLGRHRSIRNEGGFLLVRLLTVNK